MTKIDTVLFDFDGTLLNSNQLIAESHLHVLNKYFPNQFDRKKVQAFNGPPLIDVYKKLDEVRYEQLIREYREYNHKYHDDLVELFPDVISSLKQLKKAGKTVAIVSNKRREAIEKGLQKYSLHSYFDLVLTGDDFTYHKPHREPVEMAVQQLQAEKKSTIMIGDNWQDIESAHQAGVAAIFVRWSEKSVDEMEAYKPDKVVDSMQELTHWLLENK